ncbi:DNA-directed RNA polymerase subunit omega [uncultured Selenomonas sp.]|uniref:DNA-directed RNA polymerase subunit omega n=1 Tax=uncultured Selenomonas sp. TaxID=159275 RepID=UPI0026195DD4|nr:DNA-directed RNA polymerase subunit omega [uncultured Selenomonas sp.]
MSMADPSINKLLEMVDSRYTLVVLAAKRARQLLDGDEPKVAAKSSKDVTIALEEISEGDILYRRSKGGIK